jgi:hypothetical protein
LSHFGSAELADSQEKVINKLCPPACTFSGNISISLMHTEDFRTANLCASLDLRISTQEVYLALKSTKKRSAPGIDQIDGRILKALPADYINQLTKIFNGLFLQGAFPEEWSESLVIFIPKPHGEGVRPISLMSCTFKTMEKVIYFRLRWYVEKHNILPSFQFGFRPHKSCVDALVSFFGYAHDCLLQG